MEVDIYKSIKSPEPTQRRYIFVPKGKNIIDFPELKEQINDFNYEKTIDINPGELRIALDSDEAIRNINAKGYHEQLTQLEVRMTSTNN